MKCYTVTLETEMMVVADSRQEAIRIAEREVEKDHLEVTSIKISQTLADCWQLDHLVYHNTVGDITAEQALKLNTKDDPDQTYFPWEEE